MTDPEPSIPTPDEEEDGPRGQRLLSIGEMIERHVKRTGDSLYTVAKRSKTRTTGTTQKYLHDLQHGRARSMPKHPATFTALADGLQTTELAILLGFAVHFGLPVRLPVFASRVPYAVDDLPESVTDALLSVLRSLTVDAGVVEDPRTPDDAVLEEADHMDDDPAPRNPPAEGSTPDQ